MSLGRRDEAGYKNGGLAGHTDVGDGPELGRLSVDGTVAKMNRRLGGEYFEMC